MDTSQFGAIIRRSLRLIILVTLATAAIAFVASELLPREYQSEARVLVGSVSDPTIDRINGYQQLAQTYAALATTTPLLAAVEKRLGLTDDPVRLALRINARAPLGQSIVRITATASSPSDAAQLADGVAAQVADLGKAGGSQPSLASVVQPAIVPDGPSSPLVFLNTAIATVLGLGLGIGLALLMSTRRQARIRRQALPTP